LVDLTPAFYNLISALARYLGLDHCRRLPWHNLVQRRPNVVIRKSAPQFRRVLHGAVAGPQARQLMRQIEKVGSAYCLDTNSIYAQAFELPGAALAASSFVHAVCSGRLDAISFASAQDRFYAACLIEAVNEFGARVLHSARGATTGHDLDSCLARSRRQVELEYPFSYSEYLRMIDFVLLHQDFQCHARLYHRIPELIGEGRGYTGEKLRFVSGLLGQSLGTELYEAYLEGRVNRRYIRALYLRRLDKPNVSKLIYFQLARRTRRLRRGPVNPARD
jgi:hypothetical protein